jgi:hypothetical protein
LRSIGRQTCVPNPHSTTEPRVVIPKENGQRRRSRFRAPVLQRRNDEYKHRSELQRVVISPEEDFAANPDPALQRALDRAFDKLLDGLDKAQDSIEEDRCIKQYRRRVPIRGERQRRDDELRRGVAASGGRWRDVLVIRVLGTLGYRGLIWRDGYFEQAFQGAPPPPLARPSRARM